LMFALMILCICKVGRHCKLLKREEESRKSRLARDLANPPELTLQGQYAPWGSIKQEIGVHSKVDRVLRLYLVGLLAVITIFQERY